ncbi:hypothetical protein BA895_19150 [Humibacillus sp. DSM 29435]|uniref:DUF2231 domain-containing protein n=1 Tax=Humibacillus sp. DSM 29435 TaxID=1869167 RepID=UPI000872FEF7|nr:DUF2231 domain-containing protein [Humibacillus sp. DSM 29435]OFE16434.1 hypothetical protein BA895_19150 [Humibacillus sp. DSM 29435]
MTSQTSDAAQLPLPARIAVALENDERLDPAVDALGQVTAPLGAPGLGDVLRGAWLGHALHPSLTDVPLGLWTATSVLDLLGGPTARPAAQRLLGVGLLSVAPTAASGWAEWHRSDRPAQRVGVAHAALNVAAIGLYAGSWAARRGDRYRLGTVLALLGAGTAGAAGYLGGHLAAVRKVSTVHPGLAGGSGPLPDEAARAGGVNDPLKAGAVTAALPRSAGRRSEPQAITSEDVHEALVAQHAHLGTLLHHARVAAAPDHAAAMRGFLSHFAGHVAVESALIHPVVPAVVGSGLGLGRAAEEAGLAQQIKRLEDMDSESPIYRTQFGLFEEAMTKHLSMEEGQELPEMVNRLRDDHAATIIKALAAVVDSAPTRSGSYAHMLDAAKAQVRSVT